MTTECDSIEKLTQLVSTVDPTQFDVTVSALLIGLGAEKYVDIFRKKNIGQSTLVELTDEDLVKLGVDDSQIRAKLLDEVQNLPIFEEISAQALKTTANIGPMDVISILEESSQHLHRIYLSMLANTVALKKTKKLSDCIVYEDKYASRIALATLSEVTNILNSMEITLHTQMKVLKKDPMKKTKKIIVGAAGSVVIVLLTALFVKSLQQLK